MGEYPSMGSKPTVPKLYSLQAALQRQRHLINLYRYFVLPFFVQVQTNSNGEATVSPWSCLLGLGLAA